MGQQRSDKPDGQDAGKQAMSRPMLHFGIKARFNRVVKDARRGHLIKVDLKTEFINCTLDEGKDAIWTCSTLSCCW